MVRFALETQYVNTLDLLFLRDFNHGRKENKLKYKRMAGCMHGWDETHEGVGGGQKTHLG